MRAAGSTASGKKKNLAWSMFHLFLTEYALTQTHTFVLTYHLLVSRMLMHNGAVTAEYIANLWHTFNIVKGVLSRGSAEVTAASGSAVTTSRPSFSPSCHSLSGDAGECGRSGGIKLNLGDALRSSCCTPPELYVGELQRML